MTDFPVLSNHAKVFLLSDEVLRVLMILYLFSSCSQETQRSASGSSLIRNEDIIAINTFY